MFKKIILISAIVAALSLPMALAAQGILPEETGKGSSGAGQYCPQGAGREECLAGANAGNYSLNDFVQLAVNVANWILGIVGSLALLMFIYGGVTMIFSAGNPETVKKGKKILLNSIIGLVIVFSAYTIIQFALSALGYTEIANWNVLGK
ncbi:hypothetical protein GF382_00440 [Candidatus Falkowbacteria bacterium]|nr:hypothetical protein [Candidatus Falkowbacteria bacterium]